MVLIGRDAELHDLAAALAVPGGRGVLLAGPAGVGKSRLATELVERAQMAGRNVLVAHASASASLLPLAALAGVLPPPTAGAAQLPPILRGLLGLRACTNGDESALLHIDDAHLLDDVSATVIHQAVTEGLISIVATVRTEEPVPGSVTALWKDGGVIRADLCPLTAPAMQQLAVALLGGSSGAFGVRAGSISADDLHPGMGLKPSGESLGLPVGQHVDRLPGNHIDQDRAVDPAFAEGKIDAKDRDLADFWFGHAAQQSQQRVPAHAHPQRGGQPGTGSACQATAIAVNAPRNGGL